MPQLNMVPILTHSHKRTKPINELLLGAVNYQALKHQSKKFLAHFDILNMIAPKLHIVFLRALDPIHKSYLQRFQPRHASALRLGATLPKNQVVFPRLAITKGVRQIPEWKAFRVTTCKGEASLGMGSW